MTSHIEKFGQRIEAELAEIEASLAETREASSTVELDSSTLGRLSRADALQRQAMAQGMRERLLTRRRKLEAALARIANGTFGRCCQCDAPIDPERLEGDPAAVFCFDCRMERDTDWAHREPH